jgi:hypothetical protein
MAELNDVFSLSALSLTREAFQIIHTMNAGSAPEPVWYRELEERREREVTAWWERDVVAVRIQLQVTDLCECLSITTTDDVYDLLDNRRPR